MIIILGCFFVLLSIFDIKKRELPIPLIGMCTLFSVACAVVGCQRGDTTVFEILRSLFPAMVLIVLSVITKQVGTGDGICLISTGLVLGESKNLMALLIGAALLFVTGTVILILKKKTAKTEIPFCPFVTLGIIAVGLGVG
ncbi:MAG: hypothetical protein K6F84_00900 [Lachnospiraceae bacterium]|nr:hypothetical protein [Lachnospiraceae bacterium]